MVVSTPRFCPGELFFLLPLSARMVFCLCYRSLEFSALLLITFGLRAAAGAKHLSVLPYFCPSPVKHLILSTRPNFTQSTSRKIIQLLPL